MQVNNVQNRPNFGMALKKPEDMQKFVNYISKYHDYKIVKRGLIQIQKEQANNKYFDIKFLDNDCFSVNPIKQLDGYQSELLTPLFSDSRSQMKPDTITERLLKYPKSGEFEAPIIGLCKNLKHYCVKLASEIQLFFNPKLGLPKAFLEISQTATSMAKNVEKNRNNIEEISKILE